MVWIFNGNNGEKIASLLHIAPNKEDPCLKATLGLRCPITTVPLYTCSDPYYHSMLIDKQMKVFQQEMSYTPLVNAALVEDKDLSL